MSKDYIGFTLDVKALANALCQDPTTKQELVEGMLESATNPIPLTSVLGGANITAGTGVDTFCNVFPATVEGKGSGDEGVFYRNNTKGGKGDRIQMRIKVQTPRVQDAPAEEVLPPSAPPQLDLSNITPERAAEILKAAGYNPASPKQAAAPSSGFQLPDDIAAVVGD